MAKLLKKFDAAAWNKFVRHLKSDDAENLSEALLDDWIASPNRFIVESGDWALPLWISRRPPSKFLIVSEQEWLKYGSWDNIIRAYLGDTPLGRIEKLHTMWPPLYHYHPELAFIMNLPDLRAELKSVGLNIGLSFIADAVIRPDGDFIDKFHKGRWDYSLDKYLNSCGKLLPGYRTRFAPMTKEECQSLIAEKKYNFRNEYAGRLQYQAIVKNLYAAKLEYDGHIRCVVFFALNSRNQLQYLNRCYYGEIEYTKMMFNLCVLSTFDFCRENNLDCDISQVILFNFDKWFGWGCKDSLWNFQARNYPYICGRIRDLDIVNM